MLLTGALCLYTDSICVVFQVWMCVYKNLYTVKASNSRQYGRLYANTYFREWISSCCSSSGIPLSEHFQPMSYFGCANASVPRTETQPHHNPEVDSSPKNECVVGNAAGEVREWMMCELAAFTVLEFIENMLISSRKHYRWLWRLLCVYGVCMCVCFSFGRVQRQ